MWLAHVLINSNLLWYTLGDTDTARHCRHHFTSIKCLCSLLLPVWLLLTAKCVSNDMHPLPFCSPPHLQLFVGLFLSPLPDSVSIISESLPLNGSPLQKPPVSSVCQLEMHLYVHLQRRYVLPFGNADIVPPVHPLIARCTVASTSSFRC